MGGADLVEAAVERGGAVGRKSRAEVVEQVRHAHKERRAPKPGLVVADRGSKVGFAAAVRTIEYQPALGRFGEFFGDLESFAQGLGILRLETFVLTEAEGAKGLPGVVIEARKFGVTDIIGWIAVIRREDFDMRDQVGVLQAGTDAGFKVVQRLVAGNDRWKLVDVAVVDDLEELFLRPGGRVLGAEVVHDQKRNRADLGEAVFKAGIGGVAVGEAQPVEQIGHGEEERADAHAHRLVGDCRCEVGLAAAVGAGEQQPAVE